jgi:hypothetical protein
MFSPDESEPEEAAFELVRRSDALTLALHEIGLYVKERKVVAREENDGGPRAAMFVTAALGRVAFGDRVQRPDQAAVDAMFEDMTDNMVEAEFEERKRALDD